MNQHFAKEYKTAMKKIINSEGRTIAKAIESIDKSEKIKENCEKVLYEKVLVENDEFLIIEDDWSKHLNEYAKKKIGDDYMVAKAFSKKENRVVSFLLYYCNEPVKEDTSFDGMASRIDFIYMIHKSQEWE